jgi:Mechanosensitive ion channel, beta-domain/Mechanosensitive ion channel, transmembrane helices 2/3
MTRGDQLKPKSLSLFNIFLLLGLLLTFSAVQVRGVRAAPFRTNLAAPLAQAATSTPLPSPTPKPTSTHPALLPTPPPILQINPRALATDLIPRLINTAIIVLLGLIITFVVRRLVFNMFGLIQLQVQIFVTRLIYLVIWFLAILWILSVFDVAAATLAAIIGTLGLALSLASQDLFKNFIAGLYLLAERPFRVGDEITISTYTGKVDYIDLRTTIITTGDHQQVIIPNTMVLSQVVVINRGGTILHEEEAPAKVQAKKGKS